MKKTKHLLLWSSLATFALLVYAATEENVLKDWRQIQASTTLDAAPLEVRLRQIVVPDLKATDRCVSCHVGMAPEMQGQTVEGPAVAGAHPPMHHGPAEFGCTVCHGGQGRATEAADAHGHVPFWPNPMLAPEHSYAGCGSCHAYAGVPTESSIVEARNVFERHDCLACHRVDGRGGTFRPDGGGMEGPDLSGVGLSGYDPLWYEQHLARLKEDDEGLWKNSFAPLDSADLAAVERYLACCVGAPQILEAKSSFLSAGCLGCHKIDGVGGDDGPDLTHIGARTAHQLDFTHVEGEPTAANWHAEHLRNPARVVADSKMPAVDMPEEEIERLVLYLLSLRRQDLPDKYLPPDRVRTEKLREREFSTEGATMYAALCSACHGEKGEGVRLAGESAYPAIANPDFLAASSNEFLRENIRRGRPGRRMPAWREGAGGLRNSEIDRIVEHLRELGGVAESEPKEHRPIQGDPARGKTLYAQHCASCHGEQGEGGEALALNHPDLLAIADDAYLIETIGRGRRGTEMHGFRRPSTVRPVLTPEDIESIVAFVRTWEEPSR